MGTRPTLVMVEQSAHVCDMLIGCLAHEGNDLSIQLTRVISQLGKNLNSWKKSVVVTLWATRGKFGLLYTPTSEVSRCPYKS